jgi:hypothetical protein
MFPDDISLVTRPNEQIANAVAAMPTEPDQGQYVVGFGDYTPPTAEPNLWALRLTGEVQPEGGDFPVFESPEEDSWLGIAANENTHQYLVVSQRTFVMVPDQPSVILGRELSLEGHFLGEEDWIGGEQATTPAASSGPAGEYLVVFADKPGTSTFDIYGRLWGVHRVFLPVVLR